MITTGLSEILSGEYPQIDEQRLVAMLRELLAGAGANDGKLEPEFFWTFVAALAQGRGIADRLREAGQKGADAVATDHPAPAKTLVERERRARYIRALARLLGDVSAFTPPGALVPPPDDFPALLLLRELMDMLAGKNGTGASSPQVLFNKARGELSRKRSARNAIVGVVLHRAERDGKTVEASAAHFGLEGSKWDEWLRAFGGQNCELGQAARACGRGESRMRYWPSSAEWSASDAELAPLLRSVGLSITP